MSEFDATITGGGRPIPADTPQKPCLTVLYGGPVGLVYTLPVGSETLIGRDDGAVRVDPDYRMATADMGLSQR